MNREFEYILKRGVAEVIIEEELRRLLESGRPLRLKEGFDPSCPDIHLGHVVGLRKLRQFQDLGHQVVLIVGDWTAQIGDPSGQSQIRSMLTADEVKANAETYMAQFFKVVEREKTEIRWQSEWFGNFTLADVISLTSKFTVAQIMAREDFSTRQAAGRPIGITELLYPLLQAYDSVMVESDVEFGGIDQKFNCLMGRELQQMMGQRPQQVFFTPLLVGTDGKMKMSKSLGNYIAVEDPPDEMYGKVMSLPDNLIMDYFELTTDIPDEELDEYRQQLKTDSVNPMMLKKRLAREIVTEFHSKESADNAETQFKREIQDKKPPEETLQISVQEINEMHARRLEESNIIDGEAIEEGLWGIMSSGQISASITLILSEVGLVKSKSEARRLIEQKAIHIIHEDGSNYIVYDDRPLIRVNDVIKVGKRRWVKIVNADTR